MRFRLGAVDAQAGTVEATFWHNGIRHVRLVNAIFGPDGSLDKEATDQRLREVGLGVARKIERGLIGPATKT